MISSEDVRRVTFERAMRGYRCEDVDDYLKQVADAMDALAEENADMQNKMRILGQRIDQYRSEEDTLRTTMINAQRMGENVIKEAKQKAAETIRAANIKAEDREQRARDEVELAQQEVITLKREADAFKKMLLDKYREHIELLSKFPSFSSNENEGAAKQVQPKPAPEPEPIAVQAPAPQPEPEPLPVQPAPQREEAAVPQQPAKTEKIDTVEFAIAPKPNGAADMRPDAARMQQQQVNALFGDGAGLYEDQAPKQRSKTTTKPKTTRKPRSKASEESLPAAFDSFEGVDFDS